MANGNIPKKYEKNQYPAINEVRWLTFAIRTLGYWIRHVNPSDGLKIIAKFVSQCYAPTHMEIQLEPELEPTTYHYFSYLKRAKVLLNIIIMNNYCDY